jgi:hypothetical protein
MINVISIVPASKCAKIERILIVIVVVHAVGPLHGLVLILLVGIGVI